MCLLALSLTACRPEVDESEPRAPGWPFAAERSAGLASSPDALHSSGQQWFSEIRGAFGEFRYASGHRPGQATLLETVGGGVALLDADLDGYLDLFFAGGGSIDVAAGSIGGRSGAYFRNRGGLQFDAQTAAARLEDSSLYSHGATVLDYDRDGWPDVLVTGLGGQRLYQNQGDGTFVDRSRAAGLDFEGWSTAAVAADFDSDGDVDIFVTRYCRWTLAEDQSHDCGDAKRKLRDACPPQLFAPDGDRLFFSAGDGTFVDQSASLASMPPQRGLGVAASDFNSDGAIDVYVANDAGPNHLFLGAALGGWRDEALLAGVSGNEFGAPEGSMGIAVGDTNGDGRLDLYVTNFELENNSLYEGLGNDQFRHATVSSGLAGSGAPTIGFGTALADFDADGWEDLIVANGSVFYHTGQLPFEQPALLYKNLRGRFADAVSHGGTYFQRPHAGRGLATGDLDNDGATDIVIVDQIHSPTILHAEPHSDHWLGVCLRRSDGSHPALGAQVTCEFRGRQLHRWVAIGAGYLSYSDERLLFPVDVDEPPGYVEVLWPSGVCERFGNLPRDHHTVLIEGQGVETPPKANRIR